MSNETSIISTSDAEQQQQPLNSTSTPILADYKFQPRQQEMKQRRDYSKKLFSRDNNEASMAIRMMWGNAQTRVDGIADRSQLYVCQQDPDLYLKRSGHVWSWIRYESNDCKSVLFLIDIGASPQMEYCITCILMDTIGGFGSQ